MNELEQQNDLKDFTKGSHSPAYFDKTPQLTPEMSIDPSSADEYESEIKNLGGIG